MASSLQPAATFSGPYAGLPHPPPTEQYPIAISTHIEPELEKGLDCWSVFSPASGHMPKDSLNLGQGFMNWNPPDYILQAARTAMQEDIAANHYSIPKGRLRLRKALSSYLSPSFDLPNNRALDPETEIAVTAGANFAIYAALKAFVSEGNEVVVIEPFFDQYIRNITFCGGTPVCIPLRPPPAASSQTVSSSEWNLDLAELRGALKKGITKVLILNTPHNPVGKVFSEEELRGIGEVAEEFNLLVISDEVYDCLTFSQPGHVRLAALSPQFWNRTITVCSAGKSFACTGWRVGWAVAPPHLLHPLVAAATRIVFSTVSPLQEAVAAGLEGAEERGFWERQRRDYLERRNVLMKWLDQLGLPYTIPDGAYFILIENTRLQIPDGFEMIPLVKSRSRDWHVSWFIAQTAGVVCIPPSDFYSKEHVGIGENFTRIAFCKDISTLEEAGKRLQQLKPYIKK